MADLLTAAMIEDDMEQFDNLQRVEVRSINPDTGATLATATDVIQLRRVIEQDAVSVGDGEVPKTTSRQHLRAKDIRFNLKKHDKIIDDMGTWVIDSVKRMTFNTRYQCETTLIGPTA